MAGVEQLYPYLIPREYLVQYDDEDRAILQSLGHDLHVALVFDLDGLVRNATLADLRRLGLTIPQARARALANLEAMAKARRIQMSVFQGPGGRPFLLVGGSWAAATAILLSGLRDRVGGPLGTTQLCASVPHREAMLVFAEGDRAYRDVMRALVKEKESDGAKPLTFELFSLTDAGVKPFVEPGR